MSAMVVPLVGRCSGLQALMAADYGPLPGDWPGGYHVQPRAWAGVIHIPSPPSWEGPGEGPRLLSYLTRLSSSLQALVVFLSFLFPPCFILWLQSTSHTAGCQVFYAFFLQGR